MTFPMDTSVRRASSVRSFQSVLSAKKQQLFALMGKQSSLAELAKLAALSFLPLALVSGLCIKSLLHANRDIDAAKSINVSVIRSQNIGTLVSALLSERAIWCEYTSSKEQYPDIAATAFSELLKAQSDTNWLLQRLAANLPQSLSNFTHELGHVRAVIVKRQSNFSCIDIFNLYMHYINKLEEECTRPFSAGGVNSLWSAYFARSAVLVAQETVGIQRAYGLSYYGFGIMSMRNYIIFAKNLGSEEPILQQVASVLYPPAVPVYAQLTESNTELVAEKWDMVEHILKQAFVLNDSIIQSRSRYFNITTAYINMIAAFGSFVTERMLGHLDTERSAQIAEFQIVLSFVILVSVASPALITWYGYRSRKMMHNIAHFTECLKEQNSQLQTERKKADLLLCQMLPKSVVRDMAQNKSIEPESFDEATVFFSCVDDFLAFVVRSEPFQIVDLLNHLYNKCDDILDQYDVYKVETIGDSYMVVSGVPRRNGHQHSAEIATIALHFLMMMDSFKVSSLPGERLKLKLGVHTGQVVAGVMGIKQQRYCLFGDTVNIASRMMSTGMASHIQLSPESNDHLQKYHCGKFTTSLRGSIKIKGRGVMKTHWLVGRNGFPYKVHLLLEDEDAKKEKISNHSKGRIPSPRYSYL